MNEEIIIQNIREEMKKLGVDENDFKLITKEVVDSALCKKYSAKDIAWALLQ